MISGPGFMIRYREDEATRQQLRPGTARRVWPYLRRYRGQVALLVAMTAVESAVVVVVPLFLLPGKVAGKRHGRGRPGLPLLRRGETAPRPGPAAAQGPVGGRA